MKRTTCYLTLSIAIISLAVILSTPGALSKVNAKTTCASAPAAMKISTADEATYWYFVVTYSDTDKRVTNTFYSSEAALKVYYKVRLALGGFQGDLEGISFATRQEAEDSRAANWANAQVVTISDPLE
jgi:hypothetical protein